MGIPTLITTNNITSDTSLSAFTSSIDSTYDEYMFVFTDTRASTNDVHLSFAVSTDGGTGYGIVKTTTHFQANHYEDASGGAVAYQTDMDIAQSAAAGIIAFGLGNDADQSVAGVFHLFSPSNTTYVTHFYSRFSNYFRLDASLDHFCAGYINSAGDVDAIKFYMSSGNIGNSTIQMYGIA